MKQQPITVSIGIPAYNEEANIRQLLISLLAQKGNFTLEEIMVVSDGSSDHTAQEASQVKNPIIRVANHTDRKGKTARCNEIAAIAKGEVLVLFDADVIPADDHFIERLVQPFLISNMVGLAGADTISIAPKTFFEKIIADSHTYKQKFYRKINGGNNIYLCHGRARAFRKAFYKQLQWVANFPEDAQTYLFCIQKGFSFVFVPKAKVLFRSPATLADHIKQHDRYVNGKRNLTKLFPKALLKKEYRIPPKLFFAFLLQFFRGNAVSMLSFVLINLYLVFRPQQEYKSLWTIAETSKQVL